MGVPFKTLDLDQMDQEDGQVGSASAHATIRIASSSTLHHLSSRIEELPQAFLKLSGHTASSQAPLVVLAAMLYV